MVTTFGMCPGVKTGESRQQALARQIGFYGRYRAHRLFFDNGLMDPAEDEYDIITEGQVREDEDLWVSCKDPETTNVFRNKVAELRDIRRNVEGKTLFTLKHEPEGDLTVAQYNQAWDIVAPVLAENSDWLMPGPILTAFRSRKVNADGVREFNWRDWVPTTPSTRALLQFAGQDLYPGAGRPTKSKPKYYEDPGAHPSPYGNWTELGFCGILDEMCDELGLPGAIGEINHERPSVAGGWPSTFTDPNGELNASWMSAIVAHARAQKYLMVAWFHKGGGILTDRSGQTEANYWKQVLQDNWSDVDEPPFEPDPNDPQYQAGFTAGAASRDEEVAELTDHINHLEGLIPIARQEGRTSAFTDTKAWIDSQMS